MKFSTKRKSDSGILYDGRSSPVYLRVRKAGLLFALQSDGGCAILYLFIEAAVHSCIKFYIRERFKIRKRGAVQSVCDGEHKSSESKSTGKIG